ncbi:TerC family integral membrane protein [Mycobacteroides abscessus subsp. abscessus]|nr:TerC family integral membrane protein [Mycobacteroides abscessus subsp. abscessus]
MEMNVPFWVWAAVLGFILIMLMVDLFAHRRAHVIGVREAAVWSAVWVTFGVALQRLRLGHHLQLLRRPP